ncbi:MULTISPECIES: AI-2E family transporter [unclassified Streptomyces]|uniref:AI-2E family transporter n=1 Tax=unclassified Streptomyces TaxID=2593676 RepID=UPI001BE719E3|nr:MULTISPECIES: AI-2E family transporter [unclassified Streptomyces]MBT2407958.1 AI-2E family transporter [Streptomyces sp. ISL-21]MBT2610547.1 AI-2E family transporter [Streptomyces sp. ISL-87]
MSGVPPAPTPLLPETVRRLAAWCAVVLLVTAVLAVVVWLCTVFRTVVTPVLLAVLGTALLGPMHRRLVRLRVNRSLAAALTCLAVVAVVGGASYIVVLALIETGDQIVDSLRRAGESLAEHFGALGTSLEDVAKNSKDLLAKFGGTAASGVVAGLSVVGTVIATALLALVLIFFFLRDSDRAVGTLRALVPSRSGDLMEAMGRRAFEAVEGFMRGTSFVALVDGVLIGAGLLVLRVPGALGLAALVFVTAYIPYLGAILSGAVAVLVALADRGWAIGLWALGLVLLVQMIEGYVLQPVVQSRTVQMHPAVVMLAITAGASVAGILGMLLAVPLTAAAFGVVSELRTRYAAGTAPGPVGPA